MTKRIIRQLMRIAVGQFMGANYAQCDFLNRRDTEFF